MCIVQGSDSFVIKESIAGIFYIRGLMEGKGIQLLEKGKNVIKEMLALNKQDRSRYLIECY